MSSINIDYSRLEARMLGLTVQDVERVAVDPYHPSPAMMRAVVLTREHKRVARKLVETSGRDVAERYLCGVRYALARAKNKRLCFAVLYGTGRFSSNEQTLPKMFKNWKDVPR